MPYDLPFWADLIHPPRTWYVNATTGNDANNGNASSPFASIAGLAAAPVRNSDRIELNRGDVFRRTNDYLYQLWAPTVHGIRLGAYGDGADPILNGSTVITGWSVDSGTIYKASTTVTFSSHTATGQCWVNDSRLNRVTAKPTHAGEFWLDSANSLLYVWLADSSDPTAATVELTNCVEGLDLSSLCDWSVDHVQVHKCMEGNWYLRGTAKRLSLTNCTSIGGGRGFDVGGSFTMYGNDYNSKRDFLLLDCTSHEALGENFWIGFITNCAARNCVAYNGGMKGKVSGYSTVQIAGCNFSVADYALNCLIENCTAYNGFSGTSTFDIENEIDVGVPTNTIYRNNYIYSGEGTIVLCADAGYQSQWYNNKIVQDCLTTAAGCLKIWNGSAPSRDVRGGTYGQYYHNTFIENVDPTGATMLNLTACDHADIRNNIFKGSNKSSMRNVAITTAAVTNLILNYNSYCGSRQYWRLNSTDYTKFTVADGTPNWVTTSGYDANSINSTTATDPQFTTEYSDLSLQAGSPCKAKGTPVGILTDYAGNARSVTAPSIGAYE